jgi:methyl-accepting chemotaxis protein
MKTSFFTKLSSLMAHPAAVPASKTAEFDTLTTDNAIAEATAAVAEVDDVIKVINDISAQINFMSKHAAIESARARDYGKEILVVSDEMETLSERTSKKANEIFNSLQYMTAQIQDTKVAGQDSLDTIANIQKEVELVADVFSDVSHTPTSLSEGTTQIANTVKGLQ